jgi:hypothetical protein
VGELRLYAAADNSVNDTINRSDPAADAKVPVKFYKNGLAGNANKPAVGEIGYKSVFIRGKFRYAF